jgi:hypothetical protein
LLSTLIKKFMRGLAPKLFAHAEPELLIIHPMNQTKTTQLKQLKHDILDGEIESPSLEPFIETFRRIVANTPRDRNFYLQYFIDFTKLPANFANKPAQKQNQILEAAKIPLSMIEGYHAFSHTNPKTRRQHQQPVWLKLPHEPDHFHQDFQLYLRSAERQPLTPATDNRALQKATQLQQTGKTSKSKATANLNTSALELDQLDIYTFYYWEERARSYDILQPVAAARLRDQRILDVEDKHFKLTGRLIDQLETEIKQRFDDQDGRPWAGLQAKDLIAGIDTLVRMQRTALGHPATGPKPLKDAGFQPAPHASVARGIQDSVTNYHGLKQEEESEIGRFRKKLDDFMANDPAAAEKLQALAIETMLAARSKDEPPDETP